MATGFREMEILDAPIGQSEVDQRLRALVRYERSARRTGVQLLNKVGLGAEATLARFPGPVRKLTVAAVERALMASVSGAQLSRNIYQDESGYFTRGMATALGALGGLGGLSTALAELPLTTTLIFRAIQDVAQEYGFDSAEPGVQFDCIQVFSNSGPLDQDDGADFAFLSTRLALNGATVQALIRQVAPRVAALLGQKLAAQAVPLIGAIAGAGTNAAFLSYFRNMTRVHFGLRRLSIEADIPMSDLFVAYRNVSANTRSPA